MRNIRSIAFLLLIALSLGACVNHFEEEPPTGSIPMSFSSTINNVATRVADNSFEKGDEVGLYSMITGNTIAGSRHINNLCLVATDANLLATTKPAFYPEGDVTVDFIAYYPYQSSAVADGASTITVEAQKDQSEAKDFSLSDFLVAKKAEVEASNNNVELEFAHKQSKICFTFVLEDEEEAETLCEANPAVYLSNCSTTGTFDLNSNSFTVIDNDKTTMVAGGDWEVTDGKLTGKELIIIPQPLSSENKIIFKYEGRLYECDFPDLTSESTSSGMQYNVSVNVTPSETYVLSGASVSIGDWTSSDEELGTENKTTASGVYLPMLDFEESNVYRIYSNGVAIAEICKEYLISESLTGEAIVAYPVSDEKADLSNGTVLKFSDGITQKCGGKLVWDADSNTPTYTEGEGDEIEQIYFTQDGSPLFEAGETSVSINLLAYTVRDPRESGTLKEYAIVKIGTQYWMRENLATAYYSDGTEITLIEDKEGIAGYACGKGTDYEYYFYSGEAVLTNKVSPFGWKIPSTKDWEILTEYIDNTASMLKAGVWKVSEGKELAPIDNKTMFTAFPAGSWNIQGKHTGYQNSIVFWCIDEETSSLHAAGLSSVSTEIMVTSSVKNDGGYKVYSIRCIKE